MVPPPGVVPYALIVAVFIALAVWGLIAMNKDHVPGGCEFDYAQARTAADTARIDDITPVTHANVRAKCGSMRRALERARDSTATAHVPRD
jgi:hypothetical protein